MCRRGASATGCGCGCSIAAQPRLLEQHGLHRRERARRRFGAGRPTGFMRQAGRERRHERRRANGLAAAPGRQAAASPAGGSPNEVRFWAKTPLPLRIAALAASICEPSGRRDRGCQRLGRGAIDLKQRRHVRRGRERQRHRVRPAGRSTSVEIGISALWSLSTTCASIVKPATAEIVRAAAGMCSGSTQCQVASGNSPVDGGDREVVAGVDRASRATTSRRSAVARASASGAVSTAMRSIGATSSVVVAGERIGRGARRRSRSSAMTGMRVVVCSENSMPTCHGCARGARLRLRARRIGGEHAVHTGWRPACRSGRPR